MLNKYKAGQKVILKDKGSISEYAIYKSVTGLTPSMAGKLGSVMTIISAHKTKDGKSYYMLEDGYAYDETFIEKEYNPVVELLGRVEVWEYFGLQVYNTLSTLLPDSYALRKVVIKGKTVTVILEDFKKGTMARGVAKCHYEDEFVESKGMYIAIVKAMYELSLMELEQEVIRAKEQGAKTVKQAIKDIERL